MLRSTQMMHSWSVQGISGRQPIAANDDAIDQLTEQLAAFCFEQIERNVSSDDLDLNMNALAEAFEDELRVRYHIVIKQ